MSRSIDKACADFSSTPTRTDKFLPKYVGLIVALRLPLGYALLFPFSLTAQAINMMDGWLKQRAGKVEWKKRFYG